MLWFITNGMHQKKLKDCKDGAITNSYLENAKGLMTTNDNKKLCQMERL